MKTFKYQKIEDLVSRVKVGFVGPISNFYCTSNDGVPLIRTTDLDDINLDKLKFVTNEFHKKNRKSQVKPGDLIVARHGDNGAATIFDKNYEAQVLNAVIIEPNPKKLSSYLLKIFLEIPFVIKQIKGSVKGSVQGVINTKHIAELLLPICDNINYGGIENLIYSIDKKIKINNLIIDELNSTVKTLYDYWFVQFNFPGALGKAYKDSGGRMVWNEKVKKEIPAEWDCFYLKDLLLVLTGKEDANFATENGNYPFFTCSENISYCDKYAFDGKAILLSGNGNFNIKLYEGKFNAYQRTYVLIPSNADHYTLVYHAVKNRIKSLSNGSRGSVIKFITKGDIEDITVILPKSGHKDLFHILNTLTKKIELTMLQNQKLSHMRNWVLPMLMNGQITFK